MGIKGQRFRLQQGWFIGLMKVEWILCNLCKWTRRSREESGRRRYELGPNWRSKIWTVTTTTSPMTGGHAELLLGGHEDKVSSKNGWRLIWTNPKDSMNPKFGRTNPSRRKCWEENMSTLDKNQIWFTQFLMHGMNPINDICTVASPIYHISSWNTESSSCNFLKISRVLGKI